jgi:hypothetical protein
LAVALWSVRDEQGKRRLRLALPITLILTVAVGYALYVAPGVDMLGFLPTYGREFFNIAPIPQALINLAGSRNQDYWTYVNPTMMGAIILTILGFILFPAKTPQRAVLRCMIPIGIYMIINMNLFSWYMLFMLPFLPLALVPGRWAGFRLNAALGWLLFSGLVMVSYDFFVARRPQSWEAPVEFLPLYGLLGLAFVGSFVLPLIRKIRDRQTRMAT